MKLATFELGLATYRALVLTFEPCREWLATETDPTEIALFTARLELIDSARVLKSRAMLTMNLDHPGRPLLAEDLRAWGEAPGLIAEFETSRPNQQIRYAFCNLANHLDGRAR